MSTPESVRTESTVALMLGGVGVVGLGAMGEPMARHLLAAHGALHLAGRTPRPQLVAAGATWHASYRELGTTVGALLLMLPDLPQAREVLFGAGSADAGAAETVGASRILPDGVLAGALERDGELLVLLGSTSSAPGVRRLGAELEAASGGRVRLVDAPVSGGEDGAIEGTLSIMMGGGEVDCGHAESVLSACGTPVRLGPLGSGQVAKACNQLVVSATILALGEATVLAERSGLDAGAMWDLLEGGYAGSRLLSTRKQRLVEHDDSPSGAAKYLLKDLRCAGEVAQATGTDAPLLPVLERTFSRIVEAGLGEQDMAVTRRYVEERSSSPRTPGIGSSSSGVRIAPNDE